MKGRNCPNCGAVVDLENNKCSYCGTPYYDLSVIPIGSGKPFYLTLNIGTDENPQLFTTKVYPQNVEIVTNRVWGSTYRDMNGCLTHASSITKRSFNMEFVEV